MKLLICEKPSVAQTVAKVIGAGKRCDGYLEGGGYLVSWCVGHLVELARPSLCPGRTGNLMVLTRRILRKGRKQRRRNRRDRRWGRKRRRQDRRHRLSQPEISASRISIWGRADRSRSLPGI